MFFFCKITLQRVYKFIDREYLKCYYLNIGVIDWSDLHEEGLC